jgi:hypothetical protein
MKDTLTEWETQRSQEISGTKAASKVVNLWQRAMLKDKHHREVSVLSSKIDAVRRMVVVLIDCGRAPIGLLGVPSKPARSGC